MGTIIWPPSHPPADRLLRQYLNRAAPGWALRALQGLSGNDLLGILWTLAPMFEGRRAPTPKPEGEIELDEMLERMAAGGTAPLHALSPVAKTVLHARFSVAAAGATVAMFDPTPVMRLPHGLDPEQQRTAVLLRLLYQGPLSIEGLD